MSSLVIICSWAFFAPPQVVV